CGRSRWVYSGVPYGAPEPSASSRREPGGGRCGIIVRRHPVQGCAVWRPQARGSEDRGVSRHRGVLSFWLLFLWRSKEKVTLGAGAEHPLVVVENISSTEAARLVA